MALKNISNKPITIRAIVFHPGDAIVGVDLTGILLEHLIANKILGEIDEKTIEEEEIPEVIEERDVYDDEESPEGEGASNLYGD